MAQRQNKKNEKSKEETVKNPCEFQKDGELEQGSPISEERTEQINETGAVLIRHKDAVFHCLTIIGQIEGHYILPSQNKTTKYEHLIPQLVAVEEEERVDGLLVLLNTVGGDVEAGLALAELIAGINKPSVSIVLGGGHSIGIPLAVSADKSYIAKSASMTVHPVRTTGLMIGAPQTFEYFRRMQDRITTFISDNSGISKERYTELVMNTGELVMDVGTILEGDRAVEEGLIDCVGTLSEAIDCLYSLTDKSKSKKKKQKA